VPPGQVTASIQEQLSNALEETGVSARELGRRLSDGTPKDAEAKRRWVQKILAGDIQRPNMAPVAVALGKPRGYFTVPAKRTFRPAELEDRLDLIEERMVAALNNQAKVIETIATLERAVVRLTDVVEDKLQPAAQPARRSSRRSA
jgi:malonyl CoA-acyl carrier protein transacylase